MPTYAPEGYFNFRFIHNDHLGTPQAVTDESGQIVWSASYQPFGEATVDEDPDGDSTDYSLNIRFPGQYYDAESKLHYNYFRDYDPGIGRYLESDPIGLLGGINTFVYVGNNPIRWTDPRGENYDLFGRLIGAWDRPSMYFHRALPYVAVGYVWGQSVYFLASWYVDAQCGGNCVPLSLQDLYYEYLNSDDYDPESPTPWDPCSP